MSRHGTRRVVIEAVEPQVDGGRFPVKRSVGEEVRVEADVFTDGHDQMAAALLFRREADPAWTEVPMAPLSNDRWQGSFTVATLGHYRFTIRGWIDRFGTWRRDLAKRIEADQDVAADLLIGAGHIEQAVRRAHGEARRKLRRWADRLRSLPGDPVAAEEALDDELAALMAAHADRRNGARLDHEVTVVVDRERARFGSWYEFFPRSAATEPGRHGTLQDATKRLDYVASMSFDVVYLPPIHPIGHTFRKGLNNDPQGGPDAVGSPWAIGSEEGGHTAIHPDLGTMEDFDRLVERARELGMEVAMDLAYQCSPDHPWVRDHPEWFRHRPDGTIQYAENPPKKYQDIYPLDFETPAWRELWTELKRVVDFWIGHGLRMFRVDNPHTKPFPFWEWLITDVKAEHPDVIFLAEAFTRPKVMYRLAKLGFTQSYTYFAWRNGKWDLEQYFTELSQTPVREFFRGNLWPNTPDILTEYLQTGGRPAFMIRLVLAATLGANYGIYGPAFELCENRAVTPGSEEYLDSEKYQVRSWDLDAPHSLADFIGRVNRIRRDNPALLQDRTLRFHRVDNDQLIAYSKTVGANAMLMVVDLDPHRRHGGWLDLDLSALGVEHDREYQVHDLLTDSYYLWSGGRHYVELDPFVVPAHVFRVRQRLRTEHDFEYFA
jgi:starch synthase (maltosyl-transferring)